MSNSKASDYLQKAPCHNNNNKNVDFFQEGRNKISNINNSGGKEALDSTSTLTFGRSLIQELPNLTRVGKIITCPN